MASPDYRTVATTAEVENVIQKSRFIGRCFPIETEEEAALYLEEIRKNQWDATHHCYAYILGEQGQIARFSDDGEPSGTAGMPMLDVLQKRGLKNVLVVVTRYFGGVLLGAGGLVRAYTAATSDACKAAGVVHMRWSQAVELQMDYAIWGKVEHFLLSSTALLLETIFTDVVTAIVCLPETEVPNFLDALIDKTEGRITSKLTTTDYRPWPEPDEE